MKNKSLSGLVWRVMLFVVISTNIHAANFTEKEVNWNTKLSDSSLGLAGSHVYQIFEDKNGFLWIVTETSLQFFDGYKFYTVEDHSSLQGFDNMQILCQDWRGWIWVGYEDNGISGVKVFDGQSREMIPIVDFFPEGLSVDEIKRATTRSNKDFFLLTMSGDLWRLSFSTQVWTKVAECIGPGFNFAFSENQDLIWLVSDNLPTSPYRTLGYWTDHEAALRYFHIADLLHYDRFSGDRLILMSKTQLGIFQKDGLIQWNAIQDYFPKAALKGEPITLDTRFGYNPTSGDAYFVYNNYLEISNLDTKVSYRLLVKPFLQSWFSVTFANDGSLWAGTIGGLQHFEYGVIPFEKIMWVDPTDNQTMRQSSIRGMVACRNGKLLFNANGHVEEYNPRNKEIRKLFPTNNGTSDLIWDEKNQRVWTLGDYLFEYDPESDQLWQHKLPNNFTGGMTFGLYATGDTLMISSTNGMWMFRVNEKKFVPFTAYGAFTDLATAEVYGFFEYNKKELFIYTNRGIFLWEKGRAVTGCYSKWSKGKYYIPSVNVRHIHKDLNGVLWLATSDGLVRWQPEQQLTRKFTAAEGLYDQNLYAVFEDTYGFLWLSTNNGIIQFHKETASTRHYLEADGISDKEFNRIAYEQDQRGNIYFGGLNGITKFHPDAFVFDPFSLKDKRVQLTSFSVFSKKKSASLSKMEEYFTFNRIRINPSELNLEAIVAVNDLGIGKKHSYSYRLGTSGSNVWTPMQSPILRIPVLPPGKFTLEVRATDKNLRFGDSYLIIPLEVIPPVYLRKWFIILIVSLLATLVTVQVMREIRRRDKQNRLLQQLVAEGVATIAEDKKLIELQAARLELKNLEKDRFFANISHEFRTPISLILGSTELLSQQYPNNNRASNLLNTTKKNARHLLKLVNDILFLSKIDYAAVAIQPKVLVVKTFLEPVVLEFEELFATKNITLIKNFNFDPSEAIRFDEEILRVILQNLLSNAYKYTHTEGKVLLKIFMSSNTMTLMVRDNGRGIRAEDLPFIFDRYFQGSHGEVAMEGGTGIGLSLVKEVLSLVGGTVSVESEWGKGTTFKVDLPLYGTDGQFSESAVREIADESTGLDLPDASLPLLQGHQILLVEDNPDFYKLINLLLLEQFVILTAANGTEAFQILKGGVKPALIITDLMMPEMDGFQFLAKLSEDQELSKIPILVLTARVDDESRLAVFNFGVSDYMVKPFNGQALRHAVTHLVSRHLIQTQMDIESIKEQEIFNWLAQIKNKVDQNLSYENFSVDELAKDMLMGRTTFYNQVRKLTGLTPNQLILEARLQRARKLLLENSGLTIIEVVNAVGLKHGPHFNDIFKKRFGYTPSQLKH